MLVVCKISKRSLYLLKIAGFQPFKLTISLYMDTFSNEILINTEEADRGIAFYSTRFLIEFSNERFCEMIGMTRNEIHGLDIRKHIHPTDLAATQTEIDRFWNQEIETYEVNHRMIRKDGSVFWAHKKYHRFSNDKNELIYWVVAYTEIPEPV